jgi:carbamoyl-phosphate synthase large subunit
VRALRHELGIRPVYKRVDTCAAEFASSTAYMYSTYDEECEARRATAQDHGPRRRAEPHRPGHRVRLLLRARRLRLRDDGYETIMVNCNPETVSTDYDTSDRLYFEPLTLEDVLEIVAPSSPSASSCSTAARRR